MITNRLFAGKPIQFFGAFVGGIIVTALAVSHPLFQVGSVALITYLGYEKLKALFPQA